MTRAFGTPAAALLLLSALQPDLASAAWSDSVTVTASSPTLRTVTPTPSTVSCGLLQLGSTQLTWSPVPNATGYRLNSGVGGTTTEDVSAAVLSQSFSGSSGTFSVRAIFGSTTWLSASSNSKSYTSTLGVLGTCG